MDKACVLFLFLLASAFVADSSTLLPNTKSIFLRLLNRNGSYVDQNIQNAKALASLLNLNENTAMYIHGYQESVETEIVQHVINAYLNATSENILAVDYRDSAGSPYLISTSMVEKIGKTIASGINQLLAAGLDEKKLHIVGHSLGAHVAGETARNLHKPIYRITGLDPAGPLFYLLRPHLKSSDAEHVDCIHTDMGFYGTALEIGQANFYPNCGIRPQPGCPVGGAILSNQDLCSHQRPAKLYAESIRNPSTFIGRKCAFSLAFTLGLCNENSMAVMGYAMSSNTTGTYYLSTNAQSPYGRGIDGSTHNL